MAAESKNVSRYIPNQWIVSRFFGRSDWLLKLSTSWHFSGFRARVLPHFSEKRTIWYWLSTCLLYIKRIIHLSVGEEWQISTTINLHFENNC